jgi:hypothetical protein
MPAQASGEEEAKMAKTVNLMRRIVAHELHHVGFGVFVKFPGSRDAEWLLKFLMSEGIATALTLPFTEDDACYHTHWMRHAGRFGEYLRELPEALYRSRDGIPGDVWSKWVMNVGAAYYTGAMMTQAIEKVHGLREVADTVRGGVPAFLASYNRAAEVLHLAPVVDVSTLLLAERRR